MIFLKKKVSFNKKYKNKINQENIGNIIIYDLGDDNSKIGVAFRQWTTKKLSEYMIKGFVLDDDRLKGKNNNYLDKLIQKIKEIRASELNFYQKVRDVLSLSKDYMANKDQTGLFFADIQNKLLHAIVDKMAAEIICERAKHEFVNMDLTNFKSLKVRKGDVIIAKNYLLENEIKSLEKLVVMFLEYIKNYVERIQEPIYIQDWKERTNNFLDFYKYKVLNGFEGKSNKEAEELTESEYFLFNEERKKQAKIEADNEDLREIEDLKKRIKENSEIIFDILKSWIMILKTFGNLI